MNSFKKMAVLAGAIVAMTACSRVSEPARTAASVLSGASTVLRSLADSNGPRALLEVAVDLLDKGDLEGCCQVLRLALEQANDPVVSAVLALLETQLAGA